MKPPERLIRPGGFNFPVVSPAVSIAIFSKSRRHRLGHQIARLVASY